MREESHFNPNAISRSEAMGLMQLMPATAKEQAGRHKIKVNDLKQFFEPRLNTLLGTDYLGRIASRFNDELVYTAGGYNAGPTNMKRWLETYNSASPEEFVEHIPFQETKDMLKGFTVVTRFTSRFTVPENHHQISDRYHDALR